MIKANYKVILVEPYYMEDFPPVHLTKDLGKPYC